MKSVVLVGAGATLAEALPSRPSRSRTPPLDASFFELCRLAKLDGRDAVKSYLLSNFGIDPFSGRFRMEGIFNFIYADAFADAASDRCLSAYWALIRMYAAAIARTTNGLRGNSRFGVGGLLRHLLRTDPDGELTFVTFNQDLVIENAIQEASDTARYASIPWNLRTAYELDFRDYLEVSRRSRFRVQSAASKSIQVLKLHGSLNWFYNVRSGVDPRNSIRSPLGALHCVTDRNVLSGLKYRENARSVDIIPLVVPPIFEKGSRYQSAVGPVWAKAREVFEQADRVIVFGYSFPDADVAARSLLKASFHRNSRLRELTAIDVSAAVVARISDIVDAECTHHYRTVRALTG